MNRINHSSRFIEMFGGDKYPSIRLGEYTDLTWGDTNTTKNSYVSNGYLAFSASGPDGKLDHYDYDREGIVLSAIGADCGKTWFAEGKWSCIKNTIRFWSISDLLDNYFLFLSTRDKEYWPRKGGAQPFIPQGEARDCVISLPPIDLQHSFVDFANQADKSKFSGFKSRFIEMFGNAENTKPLSACIDTTFPGEWGEDDSEGTGVNVIRTTNFTNSGKLDLTNVVTRKIDQAKIDKKHLIPGDIILERSGGTADNPVGRVVYFDAKGTFLFNNFTQLLRCKDGVNSLFVFYSLYNYYHTHKSEIRSMGNKTTGIQNLKMDKYWEIPIADASPEQQDLFVCLYNQADKSKYLN